MRLLFATTNLGKLQEAQRVAEGFGVQLYGLSQVRPGGVGEPPQVVEGGPSYEANAVNKAMVYAAWSGVPTVADDSGLEVQKLNGLPGIFTARFGVSRLQRLLVHTQQSEADFVCCVSYVDLGGRTVSVTKRLAGHISMVTDPASLPGPLPYSRIFTPLGETEPLSELTTRVGYRSHRGQALAGLFQALWG